MRALLAALLALTPLSGEAGASERRPFDDPVLAARFRDLTEELRCLVCQNQSIADSGADLALDLRRQVDAMLRAGESDQAIKQFMVDRYGEFVLYRPRFSAQNLALWLGPFLLAAAGLAALILQVRRRRAAAGPLVLDEEERARLEAVLAGHRSPEPPEPGGDGALR